MSDSPHPDTPRELDVSSRTTLAPADGLALRLAEQALHALEGDPPFLPAVAPLRHRWTSGTAR